MRPNGTDVLVVDPIAGSILRELIIRLTAINVAGPSGSTFASVTGSVEACEDFDTMHPLGRDPVAILVVQRVLAPILILPALEFIADMSGQG